MTVLALAQRCEVARGTVHARPERFAPTGTVTDDPGLCSTVFMPTPDPHVALSDDEARAQAASGFVLQDGALVARFDTRTFATGLDLVNRIGAVAEKWDHHPDIELRYGDVVVRLISHDDRAITHRDIRMSRLIAECAEELGLHPTTE